MTRIDSQDLARIVIVGAGFVGSLFAEEFAKRAWAFGLEPEDCTLTLVDFDEVDDRNPANQGFTPLDIGANKAVAVSARLTEYGWGGSCIAVQDRWEPTQSVDPAETLLLVSCVDNLATRQAHWLVGKAQGVPVLHVGLSLDGFGRVEWTAGDHDTFALSPVALGGQQPVDPPSGVTPPCQLIAMRLAGHAVAVAAACAATAYFGQPDPEQLLPEGLAPERGTMLTLDTHPRRGITTRDAFVPVPA